MNPVDVGELLEHLYAAYPQSRIVEDTPVVWLQHLRDVERVDAECAVFTWIDTEQRFPTISQFKEACKREARASREAESPYPRGGGIVHVLDDGTELPPNPAQSASFFDALRESLAAARNGAGADAVAAAFQRHAPPDTGRRITYPCSCAEGRGWIEEPSGRWRPCAVCNTAVHERWLGGHLALGHRCHECARSNTHA